MLFFPVIPKNIEGKVVMLTLQVFLFVYSVKLRMNITFHVFVSAREFAVRFRWPYKDYRLWFM